MVSTSATQHPCKTLHSISALFENTSALVLLPLRNLSIAHIGLACINVQAQDCAPSPSGRSGYKVDV